MHATRQEDRHVTEQAFWDMADVLEVIAEIATKGADDMEDFVDRSLESAVAH